MSNLLIVFLLANTAGQMASSSAVTRSPGAELYYKALSKERKGDMEGAVELLDNLLKRFPEDSFCDDAMAEKARLQEENLGQPAKALASWKALAAKFPHSRLARRARSRIAFLQKHLDQGGEVLAEYEWLLKHGSSMKAYEAVDRMNSLLHAHPDFSLKTQGLLFIAGLLEKLGDFKEERRVLEEIVKSYPQKREAGLALVKLGRLAMEQGRLDEAQSAFERLKTLPGAEWSKAAQDYLGRLHQLKTGHWTFWLALAVWVLVLFVIVLAIASVAKSEGLSLGLFWPPPVEVLLFLLVMLPLTAVVWVHANQAAHALLWMTVLMTPVLTGNGILLAKFGVSAMGRIFWILGGLVVIASCVYAAVNLSGMMDQVLHTIRFGVD